jgi:hypothetical protein
MLNVMYTECHKIGLYAECHYAQCRNAKCRCAECRGAFEGASFNIKYDVLQSKERNINLLVTLQLSMAKSILRTSFVNFSSSQ